MVKKKKKKKKKNKNRIEIAFHIKTVCKKDPVFCLVARCVQSTPALLRCNTPKISFS